MATLSSELNALPLEQLIGSLASSLVKAQGLAADETARLIDQIGFEHGEDGAASTLRTIGFSFTQLEADETGDQVNESQVNVTLPLLGMVNIPSIAIDEATMNLEVRLVAHGDEDNGAPAVQEPTPPIGLGTQVAKPRRLFAVPARKNAIVDNRPVDAGASVRVTVKFKRLEQPLGIDKLLNLIDTASEVTPEAVERASE